MSESEKVIGIHQPNYIPWIGYFYKIAMSDIFVFLDDAQFEKNSFADRNSIKTPQGSCYLKIPVELPDGLQTKYNETRVKDELSWREKHLKTIDMNYRRAPFYQECMPFIYDMYQDKSSDIGSFNSNFIVQTAKKIGLQTNFRYSSEMRISGNSTERLKNIVLELHGKVYFSGFGGSKYQDESLYENNGIVLKYTNFEHPIYPQLWGEFQRNLSIIDMMFNVGFDMCKKIITKNRGL